MWPFACVLTVCAYLFVRVCVCVCVCARLCVKCLINSWFPSAGSVLSDSGHHEGGSSWLLPALDRAEQGNTHTHTQKSHNTQGNTHTQTNTRVTQIHKVTHIHEHTNTKDPGLSCIPSDEAQRSSERRNHRDEVHRLDLPPPPPIPSSPFLSLSRSSRCPSTLLCPPV